MQSAHNTEHSTREHLPHLISPSFKLEGSTSYSVEKSKTNTQPKERSRIWQSGCCGSWSLHTLYLLYLLSYYLIYSCTIHCFSPSPNKTQQISGKTASERKTHDTKAASKRIAHIKSLSSHLHTHGSAQRTQSKQSHKVP